MLSFLRQKVFPIGVDQGSSSIKIVQLARTGNGLGLVAAAQAQIPQELRDSPAALQEWTIEAIRENLSAKPFKGRKVVSCLPSRELLVQHLRVPKMDEADLERALPYEAQSKVPFNVAQGRLRHIVAGEVYEGSEAKLEVILMAASAGVVARNLNLVERTKTEIEAINIEPCALVSCFGHLLDNAEEQLGRTMFVDLGHSCSKVMITDGRNIVFCRTIGTAADQMIRTIRDKLSVDYARARELLCQLDENSEEIKEAAPKSGEETAPEPAVTLQPGNGLIAAPGGNTATLMEAKENKHGRAEVTAAIKPTLNSLCDELRGCIRYHNMIFNTQPTRRVIFLGGMAKNKILCQHLARGLGLPAQIADPVARIDPKTLTGKHSDLRAGQRYSDWAVALGLSLSGKGNN